MLRYLRAPGLALTLAVATAAMAAPAPQSAAVTNASTAAPHVLTEADLEAYLDGLIPDSLARTGIAGAVVAVVKDGQVLFEKGYGYADVAARKPIDPKATMFRPGSVSKLFTWTAVMQLQEQGRLDLDKDVNVYLDFKIPEAFGKPITLRNLMTHSPGFEEHIKNLMANDPALLHPLDKSLKDWVPERVYPPGELPAYSNYGAALAGYIVQRVSGEPFEQYVERHLFQPLAMTHSTFAQPLPKMLAKDMAKGYISASGEPQPFELISMRPAGSLSASADDLAHFMIAHLNDGAYGPTRILKPETIRLMHASALQLVPGIPGMGLGFFREDRNGHVIVGHGGDTQWFHSDMHLIVDQKVGLFISLNSSGHDGPVTSIRKAFFDGIMDRYFPAPLPADLPAIATARMDAAKVAGLYTFSRRSFSNFASLGGLIQQIPVTANDDGTISLSAFLEPTGEPKRFREVAPGRWHEVHGKNVFAVVMKNGGIDYLLSDQFPQVLVLQPVGLFQSLYFFGVIMAASAFMLLMTTLFWPVKAVLRWRYQSPFMLSGRAALFYRLTRVVALNDTLFLAGLTGFSTMGLLHLAYFDTPSDPFLRLLQILAIVGLLGAIIPLANFVTGLGDQTRPWWTKLTDGLVALSALVFAYFVVAYHVLTPGLNY